MELAANRIGLNRYFQSRVLDRCMRLGERSVLLFIVLFAAMSIVVSAVAEVALVKLGVPAYEPPPVLLQSGPVLFFLTIVFAPLLETLLLQQFPILLASRFGFTSLMQFVAGSVPFAVMHFNAGFVSGVAAGMVGGAVLSLAYLTFFGRSKAKAKAFTVTAVVHALHNLGPAIMLWREIG